MARYPNSDDIYTRQATTICPISRLYVDKILEAFEKIVSMDRDFEKAKSEAIKELRA